MTKKIISFFLFTLFSVQMITIHIAAEQDMKSQTLDFNQLDTVVMSNFDSSQDKKEGAIAQHLIKLSHNMECVLVFKTSKESVKTLRNGKEVFQRNANAYEKIYLSNGKGKKEMIMRNYMDITFTYDKNGSVYINNPESEIRHGKEVENPDKWAISGNGEVLETADQCTLSTRWTIFKSSGTLGKFEYMDDTNVDIMCDFNGTINIHAKGAKAPVEESVQITDQIFKLPNGYTRKNIITKSVYDYGHSDAEDAYQYNSIRFCANYYDSSGKSIANGYIQANFRCSKFFNEAICLSTQSYESEKAKVFSRTANLSRNLGAASGTIKAKCDSGSYSQNIILSCDPTGKPGWSIS